MDVVSFDVQPICQMTIPPPSELQGTSFSRWQSYLRKHFLDVCCQCNRILSESDKRSQRGYFCAWQLKQAFIQGGHRALQHSRTRVAA